MFDSRENVENDMDWPKCDYETTKMILKAQIVGCHLLIVLNVHKLVAEDIYLYCNIRTH